MCVPNDIQRSLAIVLRSVLEHTEEPSHLGIEAEKCERWLRDLPDTPQPDWEEAPEWAMWWAVDAHDPEWDHNANWYQYEPEINYDGRWYFDRRESDAAQNVDLPIGIDWRTTLRRRPEADDSEAT